MSNPHDQAHDDALRGVARRLFHPDDQVNDADDEADDQADDSDDSDARDTTRALFTKSE